MPTLNLNCTPSFAASAASAVVNIWQSPVSSCGKRRPPAILSFTGGERRLGGDAAVAIQHFIGHAILLRARRCRRRCRRAAPACGTAAACPGCARRSGCRSRRAGAQAVAAVFGDRDHPALVDGVARGGAVAQHLDQPPPHHGIRIGTDHQRAVLHQQPLDRLDGNAGSGPGRGIARRHFAGIGKARLQRRRGLAVDHRHLVAGARKIVGRGDADDATAEDQDFHALSAPAAPCRFERLGLRDGGSNYQATCLMTSDRIDTMSSIWLRSTIRGGDIASESALLRRYRPLFQHSTMTS